MRIAWLALLGAALWLRCPNLEAQPPIDVRVIDSTNTTVSIKVENAPPVTVRNPDPAWTDQMLERFAKRTASSAASIEVAIGRLKQSFAQVRALDSAERKKIAASLLKEVLAALDQLQVDLANQIAAASGQQAKLLQQQLYEAQRLAEQHHDKQIQLLEELGNDVQALRQTSAEGNALLVLVVTRLDSITGFDPTRRNARHGLSVLASGGIQWLEAPSGALASRSLQLSLAKRWHWWPWELELSALCVMASSELQGGYLSPPEDELLREAAVVRSGFGIEVTPRFAWGLSDPLTFAIGPRLGVSRVAYGKSIQENGLYTYAGASLALDVRLHPVHGLRFELDALRLFNVKTPLRRYEGVGASYQSLRKDGSELRLGVGYGFLL